MQRHRERLDLTEQRGAVLSIEDSPLQGQNVLTSNLVITGGGLAAVAAVAILWRRHRLLSLGGQWASRHGWTPYAGRSEDLLAALSDCALTQVGHSRRIPLALTAKGRLHLLSYVCETGFEKRCQIHRWIVAAQTTEHVFGRATITSQDWLIAAATAPTCHELPVRTLPPSSECPASPSQAGSGPIAIVEDSEEWVARLDARLRQWCLDQPADRSWEIVPGLIIGYEPGQLNEAKLAELGNATEALAELLESGRIGGQ